MENGEEIMGNLWQLGSKQSGFLATGEDAIRIVWQLWRTMRISGNWGQNNWDGRKQQ